MEPHFKLWLQDGDQLTMSDYRAALLQQVCQSGSLSAAAATMGLSYRRAWGKVRQIEQQLGYQVVRSEAGGIGGGTSRLTVEGEQLLERYLAFQAACRAAIQAAYARSFPGGGPG